jgi:hypothetical protein
MGFRRSSTVLIYTTPPRRSTGQALGRAPPLRPATAQGDGPERPLISSPVRPAVSVVRGVVTLRSGCGDWRPDRTPVAGQLVAPLIVGFEMAPPCTPHLSRIFVYVPSDMSCFRAASTGWAIPLFFGMAIPYGAVP